METLITSEGFTIEFMQDPCCEHCGFLKPFTPTIRDTNMVDWCIDCMNCGDPKSDLPFSVIDISVIKATEAELRIKYYAKEIEQLKKWKDQEQEKRRLENSKLT